MSEYVTFGQAHVHHVNGQTLDKDTVAKVYNREHAFDLFGPLFCTSYTQEEIEKKMHHFPKGIVDLTQHGRHTMPTNPTTAWQPIDTMPLDRTVLCYCPAWPDSEWLAHDQYRITACYKCISGPICEDVTQLCLNNKDAQEDGQRYFIPTHWMPLPEPPK